MRASNFGASMVSKATNASDAEPWDRLYTELDAWAGEKRIATFWWRDDDAVAIGPQLEHLFELTEKTGLLLAVIPALLEKSLQTSVAVASHVVVGQHGYSHTNHAKGSGDPGAWELGLHRSEAIVMAELRLGREQLHSEFGNRFLPIVIPPWNRIDRALYQAIAGAGYLGLSLFGARKLQESTHGLVTVNSHCDPLRWKSGPAFCGTAKAVGQIVEHLVARRLGSVDATEPTGFLTHHAVMDEASWAFAAQLAGIVCEHAAARWCTVETLFRKTL